MLAPWAIEEMKTADLEDKRLNERLTALLSAFAERPTASIPAACGGFNEMTAAYRFFDNEKVTYENILAPHAERTRERMAQHSVALLVQDTSELDFTRPQERVIGAGSLLVTTLPIENVEQVRTIIQYYTVRFLIEVFVRVLKSGCRVEERRFAHIDRLLPCVAVYLIVTWRTLMVCRLGRSCPDLDCEAIFDPSEWKSVWMTVRRRKPPRRPPRLGEILPLIAQLGGYVNYPNRRDPPGPQTLWLGMQRMYDLALAWNTFGPGAKSEREEETCV
jgi:Transposase DNA-binding/Transposase Tn5 dimerisation domain